MKNFSVRVHYSSYCIRSVKAKNEDDAISKARLLELDEQSKNEIMSNLEPWEEADEVVEAE